MMRLAQSGASGLQGSEMGQGDVMLTFPVP